MSSCRSNIDSIKQIERKIQDEVGLTSLVGSDAQVLGVLQRWQVVKAQVIYTLLYLNHFMLGVAFEKPKSSGR